MIVDGKLDKLPFSELLILYNKAKSLNKKYNQYSVEFNDLSSHMNKHIKNLDRILATENYNEIQNIISKVNVLLIDAEKIKNRIAVLRLIIEN